MAGEVQKIILLSRTTTLVGDQVFHTAPINVRDFASASISAWRGQPIGNLGTFEIDVQQSPDLRIWTDLGSSLTPSADGEDTDEYTFTMDWMRLAITVSEGTPGGKPAVSCWAVGSFVPREE